MLMNFLNIWTNAEIVNVHPFDGFCEFVDLTLGISPSALLTGENPSEVVLCQEK